MPSPELEWARAQIASDRSNAGVSPERFDALATRASVPPSTLELPEGTTIEYRLIDGSACYWVRAPGAASDRRIVYMHGGGFVGGGFHSHRSLVGWLSQRCAASVLFVEYRLAPEFRFPAGLDDCYRAVMHALTHGPEAEAAPPNSLFLAGDSAGGALAAACVIRARSEGRALPDGAIILCGMLDLNENTSKFLQMSQRTRDGVRHYVRYLADLENVLASPIKADLKGFPPLLIQTGSADYCADDNLRFAERAKEAGVATTFENWPEMMHVWHRFAPRLPEALQALESIAKWVGQVERGRTK